MLFSFSRFSMIFQAVGNPGRCFIYIFFTLIKETIPVVSCIVTGLAAEGSSSEVTHLVILHFSLTSLTT